MSLGTVHDEWAKFKVSFNKEYKDDEEHKKKFNVFNENFERILKHNADFATGKVTYEMGINQFSDLTPDEFKNRFSCGK